MGVKYYEKLIDKTDTCSSKQVKKVAEKILKKIAKKHNFSTDCFCRRYHKTLVKKIECYDCRCCCDCSSVTKFLCKIIKHENELAQGVSTIAKDVYEDKKDAVVYLESLFEFFINGDGPFQFLQTGTGFFIDKYGTLVTAAHLVRTFIEFNFENMEVIAKEIRIGVLNANGTGKNKVFFFKIIGFDGAGDIAVLKPSVKGSFYNQTFLEWGNSKKTGKGSTCVSMGTTLSRDFSSVTSGVVRDNTLTISQSFGNSYILESMFIDSPSYEGDSGSPILDEDGKIIGMKSFIVNVGFTSADSLNGGPSQFMLQKVVDKIIRTNSNYVKTYIGISFAVLTPIDIEELSISNNKIQGIIVTSIIPGSPADGVLQVNDLLLTLNGHPLGNLEGQTIPTTTTWFRKKGDKIKLEIIRNDVKIIKFITLDTFPSGILDFFNQGVLSIRKILSYGNTSYNIKKSKVKIF